MYLKDGNLFVELLFEIFEKIVLSTPIYTIRCLALCAAPTSLYHPRVLFLVALASIVLAAIGPGLLAGYHRL